MEKIIHQIWIGSYRMPKREKELSQKMKEAHPNWNYIFWDNDLVSKLDMPKNVRDCFNFYGNDHGKWEIADFVAQADILRFFLIHEFGGVYLDVDFEVRKPIDSLNLENYDAFICHHNTDEFLKTFPNGVMGSKKGNKLFKYVVESMEINNYYTPTNFANQVKKYYNLSPETTKNYGENGVLKLFERDNIFSIDYNDFHNEYCYHHALYSWGVEGKKKFKEGNYE